MSGLGHVTPLVSKSRGLTALADFSQNRSPLHRLSPTCNRLFGGDMTESRSILRTRNVLRRRMSLDDQHTLCQTTRLLVHASRRGPRKRVPRRLS